LAGIITRRDLFVAASRLGASRDGSASFARA